MNMDGHMDMGVDVDVDTDRYTRKNCAGLGESRVASLKKSVKEILRQRKAPERFLGLEGA